MDDTNETLIDSVGCPLCEREVAVERGFTPSEALWMHECECPFLLALDGAGVGAA